MEVLVDLGWAASSGSKSLDAVLLSAVRNAAPFHHFLKVKRGRVRREIPIAFQLKLLRGVKSTASIGRVHEFLPCPVRALS